MTTMLPEPAPVELSFTPGKCVASASGAFLCEPQAPPMPLVDLAGLTLGDLLRAQRRGAQLLDTRSPEEFARGHLADSTHIGLGTGFGRWARTLLCPERPTAIVSAPGREREAAMRLRQVAFSHVIGYLAGGIEPITDVVALVRHPIRISSAQLRHRLAQKPLTLVDVRTQTEWRQAAIPGSINIPLEHLRERLAELPSGPVVVCSHTGTRSSTAASLLEQTGRMNVVDLIGGVTAWRESSAGTTTSRVDGFARVDHIVD